MVRIVSIITLSYEKLQVMLLLLVFLLAPLLFPLLASFSVDKLKNRGCLNICIHEIDLKVQ